MGESAPTGASAAACFSQGVDLHELERLRVLVRFEFDRELTQDELVTALRRCHNNTREAYHFLKEQRRQAQLQATAAMVAAAAVTANGMVGQNNNSFPNNNSNSNTSTTAANGMMSPTATSASTTTTTTPPSSATSNGAKRRSDSDGDEAMDTPSKRHRSLQLRTVDLSEETDDAMLLDLTQTTQTSQTSQASPFASQPTNRELAADIINEIVARYLQGDNQLDDALWLTEVASALNLQREPAMDQQLVAVVAALANALMYVASSDMPAVQSDGVKQILEILVELPRQDQYNVELRLKPSDAELDRQVGTVDNVYALALSEELKTSQRAQAARNAITEISKACASCIARQESILECASRAQTYRHRVRSRISELGTAIRTRLDQASADVATSEREMGEARSNRAQHSRSLMETIEQQKTALIKQGEDEIDAIMDAHRKVLESPAPEIVLLRQQRDDSHQLFKARTHDVMRANTRLEFFQKLEALRQKATPRMHQWLDVSNKRIAELKKEAECGVEEKLKQHVAKLVQSLRLYYEYHTVRQQLAIKARKKEQDMLTEHEAFYEDLVPSAKRDIENKIREYNAVILQSTQQMREVASLQCDLWDGKRKVFSSTFFSSIDHEYRQLWEKLSGGARDMMSDCVQVIRDQPAQAPAVAAAAAAPASTPAPVLVTGNAMVKAEPYVFVGRGGDGAVPVMRGAPSVAASPFVDLTGDEDDKMDGNAAVFRHVAFETSPPRFTRVDEEEANSDDTVMTGDGQAELVPESKNDGDGEQSNAPPGCREFPVGADLYWIVRDHDEETLFGGRVKERKENQSYVLVGDDGQESVVPSNYLFTRDEMQETMQAQAQPRDEEGTDGRCSIM